jgi:hypothetical protein
VIKLTLAANDAPRRRLEAAETPSAERRSSQESDPINASSGLRISADNGLAVIKLALARPTTLRGEDESRVRGEAEFAGV